MLVVQGGLYSHPSCRIQLKRVHGAAACAFINNKIVLYKQENLYFYIMQNKSCAYLEICESIHSIESHFGMSKDVQMAVTEKHLS